MDLPFTEVEEFAKLPRGFEVLGQFHLFCETVLQVENVRQVPIAGFPICVQLTTSPVVILWEDAANKFDCGIETPLSQFCTEEVLKLRLDQPVDRKDPRVPVPFDQRKLDQSPQYSRKTVE